MQWGLVLARVCVCVCCVAAGLCSGCGGWRGGKTSVVALQVWPLTLAAHPGSSPWQLTLQSMVALRVWPLTLADHPGSSP
eukprot:1184778-Prorocentrum_minimum.AAC.5